MQSVLGRARAADVVGEPFPHLVIQEALEPDYYEQLAAEFPPAEIILDGRQPVSNKNFRYAANDALDDSRISPRWREFIRHHVSQPFFDEVCDLFGPHIRALNPVIESSMSKKLDEWKTSIRFREPARDIALECQFAYGAPVSKRSRTIGPHVDREVALYAGLLYMRDDEDDSEGGDLELFQFADGRPVFAPNSRLVPDQHVVRFQSIRYAKNTLVFFLQSPRSLHGVSPRLETTFPRRHINFVGELSTKFFELSRFATLAESDTTDITGHFV